MMRFIFWATMARIVFHHPAANDNVKRFHRQLKASLAAPGNPNWVQALSAVSLHIRHHISL